MKFLKKILKNICENFTNFEFSPTINSRCWLMRGLYLILCKIFRVLGGSVLATPLLLDLVSNFVYFETVTA